MSDYKYMYACVFFVFYESTYANLLLHIICVNLTSAALASVTFPDLRSFSVKRSTPRSCVCVTTFSSCPLLL